MAMIAPTYNTHSVTTVSVTVERFQSALDLAAVIGGRRRREAKRRLVE
jgi:hypothetical protein